MLDSSCMCWCALVHPNSDVACAGLPLTERQFITQGEIQKVPMCRPCADELDRLRAEFGKTRKESKT